MHLINNAKSYLLLLFCVLPLGGAAGGNERPGKNHIQYAAMGHIVYDDRIETICTESRTEPVGANLFPTPPNSEISNQMKETPTMVHGKSIIPRLDFEQRRHNVSHRLRDYVETQCEHINLEIASGSLEHPRSKRTVGVLLGLAGFATAAAALGWDAYQQVEIARHADQLKAEGELNKDEEDTSVLLSDSIRTVARDRQLVALDHYLEDLYNQWVSAISQLSALRLDYDSISSSVLKEAITKYQESVFALHHGKYSRVISSHTTVTTQGCTKDNEIRFRICLHYAPKANDADLIQVEDYGRFWSDRTQFARIDIHHHWVRDGDAWSAVNLVQCKPDGRQVWVCPRQAVQPRDVCTPSDVDGCGLDVFKVDEKFLEMREWGAGHMVATNIKEYTLKEADGKSVTHDVPKDGVFFLQVPKNQTVMIGKERITGQNAVHFQAKPAKQTLVDVDEQMLAEEFAALQKRAVRLTLKIAADGHAYATAAGENAGFFGTIFAAFEELQHVIVFVPIIMVVVAVLLLWAYCGPKPSTCIGWLRRCLCRKNKTKPEGYESPKKTHKVKYVACVTDDER
ncbi:hypothetical protein AAVH_09815 [Aphelenchoides avenae]|nr:hypothetical protein AAVH_09815 [Aphelenchus avenae]